MGLARDVAPPARLRRTAAAALLALVAAFAAAAAGAAASPPVAGGFAAARGSVPVGGAAVSGVKPSAAAATAASESPRSCGWQFRFDPDAVNVAFPDSTANYWFAVLPGGPGASLTIRGVYPHARYISLTSYDPQLGAVDGIDDAAIAPDAGSSDPFLPDAARTTGSAQRHYTVHVVFGRRPQQPAGNTVYTTSADGSHAAPFFLVIYRLYEPDSGRDITGGAGLPAITYVAPGGRTTLLPECPYPVAPHRGVNQAVARLGLPDQVPAGGAGVDPPAWHKFYNLPTSVAQNTENQYTGERIYQALRSATLSLPSGGFLENLDNKYVYTSLSHGFGRVALIHASLPTTPRTLDGEATMGSGQLRYWSICSNDAASERFYGCLRDDQVVVDSAGNFTVAVSTAADRPANARPGCGIGWIPWGPGGATLLIVRNMLAAPSFTHSIQAAHLGSEAADMGPYYPATRYLSTRAVEALGCPAGRSSAAADRAGAGGGSGAMPSADLAPALHGVAGGAAAGAAEVAALGGAATAAPPAGQSKLGRRSRLRFSS